MISRRDFLGTSLGAGAALALTPELLWGLQQAAGKLIQRAIPSSGEMLPAISFSPREEADEAAMKEILKSFLSNGGKVVDVLHGGPVGEQEARTAATALGLQDKFFWTTPLQTAGPGGGPGKPPAQFDAAAVKAAVEEKLGKFKKVDLVMLSAGADSKQIAAVVEMKKEGRIKYIGVHDLLFPASAQNPPWPPTSRLEAMMRNEPIDFIGTDYHAGDRRLEEKLLPLAQERKIGVMAYFTFDRGRLFKRVGNTPLPEWAAEFGAKSWPQFFIKYVLSHPAITVVRTGTINPAHMLENMQAGMGPLPNEAARKRMAAFVDSLPPTPPPGPPPEVKLAPEILDRYVGEYASAGGFVAIFRREGDKLIVKPGNNPEATLIARSQTRLQDPRGPVFEFEVDAQGKVTGAFLDQETPKGLQRIRLTRK